ncbi:MAG: sigma-70 family RNA polymerase sigma factor [Bacteroidales bacterium]|nr:sigma-70 family RNA polymerase sigma factor [Bacteroidales bacterium]
MRKEEERHKEFLQMLRQCEGTLLKVCFMFSSRRHDDFRDLYQEIAATLWESWPKYKGESSLNTWVTRIALNVALQEKRKQRNRPCFVEFDESFYDTLANEAAEPRFQRLYRLIDRLEDDEDRIIIYFYLDGKRLREISEIMGDISEAAVKQRIYRIKKELMTLKEKEHEEVD